MPQIVIYGIRGLNNITYASCAFVTSNTSTRCSTNAPFLFLIDELENPSECVLENSFKIRQCLVNDAGVPYKEDGGTELTVSLAVIYDQGCIVMNKTSLVTSYVLCSEVEPHIEWYEYVLDFVTGTGIYNETILFYGAFSYNSIGFFHFDLAFLFMVGIIYIFSIILLVYK